MTTDSIRPPIVGEATAEDWQTEIDMMAEDICMTCLGATGIVNPACPHCEGAGVNP